MANRNIKALDAIDAVDPAADLLAVWDDSASTAKKATLDQVRGMPGVFYVGDGGDYDTLANAIAALNTADASAFLYVPAGAHSLASTVTITAPITVHLARGVTLTLAAGAQIKLSSNVTLEGEGYDSLITCANSYGDVALIVNANPTPGSLGGRDVNISIHNLSFDGNRANNGGATQFSHAIFFRAVNGFNIYDIDCRECKGDVIIASPDTTYAYPCSNGIIRNIYGYHCIRNVVSLTGLLGGTLENIRGEDMGFTCIDIEPDDNGAGCEVSDIIVNDVYAKNIGYTDHLEEYTAGFQVSTSGTNHPAISNVVANNIVIDGVYGTQSSGIHYKFSENVVINGAIINNVENIGLYSTPETNICPNPTCTADWFDSKGAGWAYNAGTTSYDATTASSDLTENGLLISGEYYRVDVEITNYSVGSLAYVCGTQVGPSYNANGVWTAVIKANGTGFSIRGTGFTGTVDNIYIYLVRAFDNKFSNIVITGGTIGVKCGKTDIGTKMINVHVVGTSSYGWSLDLPLNLDLNECGARECGSDGVNSSKSAQCSIYGFESIKNTGKGIYFWDGMTRTAFHNNRMMENSDNGFAMGGVANRCFLTHNFVQLNSTDWNIFSTNNNCTIEKNFGSDIP